MGFLGRLIDRGLGLPGTGRTRFVVQRDLPIPMPDGVELRADWYRPRPVAARLPVVLVRSPYGRRSFGVIFGAVLARRGFQVVVQNVRGTFDSGGELHAYHQEQQDGLDTIAWLRARPWCDGRVAMAGLSYLGFTQWAVAPYLDQPLEAVCLGVTASQFMNVFYTGGALALDTALSWSTVIARQERGMLRGMLTESRQRRRTAEALASLPLRAADRAATGSQSRFWAEAIEHTGPDDVFWAGVDHSAAVGKMTTPATMTTGWYDLFLPWQLDDFRALTNAGVPARVTIGPWAHADFPGMRALLRDQIEWLSAHLQGDTSTRDRAPVRVFLQHADEWLDFDQWPPARSQDTALYLRGGRALGWEPDSAGRPDAFVLDPADPTPSVGGAVFSGKVRQQDNRTVEARTDVLVYTTPALTEPYDVVGDVRAEIFLRTGPGHADVFVRLCDVDPAGVSRNVCDGILRLRPGHPAADDGVVRAVVKMWPTGYRFRTGHRIRVQVAGGAFPRYSRNHGTGEPTSDAVRTTPIQYEILHDAQHPSHLMLPHLPG